MTNVDSRLPDSEINAYVDGELDAQALAEIETWLADHPEDAARVHAYKLQKMQLHQLYDYAKDLPIPEEVTEMIANHGVRRWMPGWRQLAAGILLIALGGFGGWFGDNFVQQESVTPGSGFVHRALSAHAVYAYDDSRPVEIGVDGEVDLVHWLSDRLGQQLHAPDLTAGGFHLIGGRLVADQDAPAALFMFENEGGQRVTLYVRQGVRDFGHDFRYIAAQGMSSFYWTDHELAYAITGEMNKQDLLKLAQMVQDTRESKAS